ncbi:MAG: BMP family ABC transporter substrate-binding protein [Anaerolineae bacterium]|nr:BMP family ABC transporter substrate-binding protein [Anaerolineae bacterium]
MLKRTKIAPLCLIVALLLVAVAPGLSTPAKAQTATRITYVVNGTLGDKSFIDSAQRGLDKAADEFGYEVNTIELGFDPANYETGLADAMADVDKYDILVAGSFTMLNYMAARADDYPDKVFLFYDASMPYSGDPADPKLCPKGCKNVYSVTYAQNQGSFLAGVYAAAMTISSLEGMNADPIIGAVGGQDIPVINDFIVGYQQGACLVNKDSKFLTQYAGGWGDPAKGKEIALAMYDQNADIIFQIAGGTGTGVFEAAEEKGKYAIGVDSDQATIIAETDPEQAAHILTSMQKNVDNSLYRALSLYNEGKLPVGTSEALGIVEGGVGISINDIYTAATPENVQKLVAAVQDAVVAGDIAVGTVFTADPADAAKVGTDCSAMPEMKFDVSEYLK